MSERALEAVAVDFLQTSFNDGKPEKAVKEHVGDKYAQHNPQVGDGGEAFVGFVKAFRSQFPEMHLDVKRTVAQGDMVVTHSHLTLKPGAPGVAVADFFRFERGKLVEHWDVIQNIPDEAANSKSMF
jgi:predicted SnoaL-like aldol condensation-catalyzing enzyme